MQIAQDISSRVQYKKRRRSGLRRGFLCCAIGEIDKSRCVSYFPTVPYDTDMFYGGAIVTSVSLSKGLEFDEVLIVDADQRNYRTEYDRSLLYVACTRAMHHLKLLYCGKKSRFLEP